MCLLGLGKKGPPHGPVLAPFPWKFTQPIQRLGPSALQATSRPIITKLTCQPQRMGTSSLLRGWGAAAAFLPGETLRGPIGVWALGPVRGSGTVSALVSPARSTHHMHHMGPCTAGG